MCGISGQLGKLADPRVVRAMTKVLAHRGPDGDGFFDDEASSCHLGHRRLKIIDLSENASQPMVDATGRFVLIFNGEIYNYVELREELRRAGVGFRTASDTEVLLNALREWGEGALDKLVGMFAFAFYDRANRSLLIARDRFGVKPLYYSTANECLTFASEIKAILEDPRIPRRVNEPSLLDYLQSGAVDHRGGETFFLGIRQLEPGHLLTWIDGQIATKRYWSLRGRVHDMPLPEAVERARALFTDAVQIRLRSDVPVGATLSGGIDSSSIVCIMDRLQDRGTATPLFLCHLQEDPRNESRYASVVIDSLTGSRPYWIAPSVDQFAEDLIALFWHQEEPFSDTSIYAHFCLMREARRRNVPVVLNGQGGDEIFVGYPSYYRAYVGSLLRKGQALTAMRELRDRAELVGESFWRLSAGALYQALPPAVLNRVYRLRMRGEGVPLTSDAETRLARRLDRFDVAGDGDDSFQHYLTQAIRRWSLPHLLRHDDRNSMAFGVESRQPFLDHRLAEFVLSLPPKYHLSNGWMKTLLREISRPILPAEILSRSDKTGFSSPMTQWLRGIRTIVEEVTGPQNWVGDWIDRRKWLSAADGFWRGRDSDAHRVWLGFAAQFWLQRFRVSA